MDYLYDRLREYAYSDYYGFHMPGHKRSGHLTGAVLPYEIDITEIEGFDDLHHAKGILKKAQERAAELYKADETHYLINGSTVGLLSAVLGCTQRGARILMARNCHKSVYNAVFLNDLHPVYLYPEYVHGMEMNGEIKPEQVDRLLKEYLDISAVIVTSPTYDGVVSDVKGIAEIVHKRNIPLILDEAHGAHFGFHPYFPENGNQCGADIVIHSIHKTLPALTQTALLHMNGSIIDRGRVRRYLHLLQSSSPSYVLMAGMDECIRMLSQKGDAVFAEYTILLDSLRKRLCGLSNMELIQTKRYDFSKLVISVKGTTLLETGGVFTGKDLYRILLEKYKLQAEMAAGYYVVLMTSPADTKEGVERLSSALYEIDKMLAKDTGVNKTDCAQTRAQEQVYTSCETDQKTAEGTQSVPWDHAEGRISVEYAYLYPPGIPLIVPGERIGEQLTEQISLYEKMGFEIEGTIHKGQIEVLIDG